MSYFYDTFIPSLEATYKKVENLIEEAHKTDLAWIDKIKNDIQQYYDTGVLEYNNEPTPEEGNSNEKKKLDKENKKADKENEFKQPTLPVKKQEKKKKIIQKESADCSIELIKPKISIVEVSDEEPARCTRSKTAKKKVVPPVKTPRKNKSPQQQAIIQEDKSPGPQEKTVKNKKKSPTNVTQDSDTTFVVSKEPTKLVATKSAEEITTPTRKSDRNLRSKEAAKTVKPTAKFEEIRAKTPLKGDPNLCIEEALKDPPMKKMGKSMATPLASKIAISKIPTSDKNYRIKEKVVATKKLELTPQQLQRAEKMKKMEERHLKAKQYRIEQEEERKEKLKKKLEAIELEKKTTPMRDYKRKVDLPEIPVYLRKKMPLLPTYDCYDSDEETNHATKPRRPIWEKDTFLLKTINYVDNQYRNSLFCMEPQVPDLAEIFMRNELKRIKRTSSAIWHTQPIGDMDRNQ